MTFTFNNPFNKTKCPYCWYAFFLGHCAIASSVNTDVTTNTPLLLDPPPQGSLQKLFTRVFINALDGPKYTQELACRECPNCKNLLPYNIEQVDKNITIAIVGDTFSGKSHYIAASIQQLQDGQMHQPDKQVQFMSLNKNIENKYISTYYRPLFENKQRLQQNVGAIDPINEPLIYELIIRETPTDPLKHINLMIYDASGEDIADQQKMVQYVRYILNADAIIFLADPTTMPGIFDLLPPHLQEKHATNRRAATVLNSVIQIFERNNRLQTGSRLSIPIAIMLPKSDLLKYLRSVSQQPFGFLRNPVYNGSVDLADLEAVNAEIKQLIYDFGDRNLLQTSGVFENVSFFATSATGWPPDKNGTYPAITPLRCLDPLLWVLWKLKVIEAE